MPPAGKRDQRITFQHQIEVQDSTGFTTMTWANLPSVPSMWAEVIEQGGREFFGADKVNAEIVTVFKTLYRDDLTSKMRIVYNGRNFDIIVPKTLGHREGLEIVAKEVT